MRFTIRIPAPPPPATHGVPSGVAVGNAVIRSRAAPIGISVTVSTGAALRAGDACSGVTTSWSSAVHSAIFRADAVILTGAVSGVNGFDGSVPPVAANVSAASGASP